MSNLKPEHPKLPPCVKFGEDCSNSKNCPQCRHVTMERFYEKINEQFETSIPNSPLVTSLVKIAPILRTGPNMLLWRRFNYEKINVQFETSTTNCHVTSLVKIAPF